jgi:hypothetical protein
MTEPFNSNAMVFEVLLVLQPGDAGGQDHPRSRGRGGGIATPRAKEKEAPKSIK